MSIQHHTFTDSTYVLHKVMVNGHKYSVWYGKDGTPFSAELVKRNGDTVGVPARNRNVWAEFERIGRPYRPT